MPVWAELKAACVSFCGEVNARAHRVTRRAPVDVLAEEQTRLHALPADVYTLAFGQTRTVGCPQPMGQLDRCIQRAQLRGSTCW